MPSATRDNHFDIAIIGAGIIGTVLAHTFGKQGRSVLLIERDLSEPDRIVGELLQPGGVYSLGLLGLGDCLEGIDAIPAKGYEVIYHGKNVHIPYPDNAMALEGRSFHHGKFIQKLRAAARGTKGVTTIEATAKDLIKDEKSGSVKGVVVRPKGQKDEEEYFASLTICADGYASNFRKHIVTKKTQVTSQFVGLELIDAVLPHPNHGHVILGNNAPILLYQIGTHETRALVDVRGKVPANKMREHLESRAADIPDCLRPSYLKAVQSTERYPSMPNSFLPPTVNNTPGLMIIGDALNMRHPLTGGGMTVAFNDAVLLSSLLSPDNAPDLDDTYEVTSILNDFHWRRKASRGGSSVINILSMALYSLFAADDDALRALQKGCFKYFERGGECVDGPVSLLAGIVRNPWTLFYHFFAVAFYSIGVMFSEMRPWEYPLGLVKTVVIFWTACVVIFPYIFSEARS